MTIFVAQAAPPRYSWCMKTSIKILNVLMPVLLLANGCQRDFGSESPCGFETSRGLRLNWNKLPIWFYIHRDVPSQATGAIARSAATWNKAIGYEAIKIVVGTTVTAPAFDGMNVIYYRTQWNDDHNKEAVTHMINSGSLLYDTDIDINGDDWFFRYDGVPTGWEVDFESLMLHEFGHTLGLGHNSDLMSVMSPYLPQGDVRRVVSPLDISNIRCEYGR